jgi:NADPH oxidase
MALGTLLKKQFTPTKLFFHFLFWVFHWGIFAYGWYVLSGCAKVDYGGLG